MDIHKTTKQWEWIKMRLCYTTTAALRYYDKIIIRNINISQCEKIPGTTFFVLFYFFSVINVSLLLFPTTEFFFIRRPYTNVNVYTFS